MDERRTKRSRIHQLMFHAEARESRRASQAGYPRAFVLTEKIGVCGKNAAQRAGARIANAAPLEEAAEHYRRYMAETSRDGLDCSPPNGVGIAWERRRRINSLDRIHRVNPGLGEDRVGVASSRQPRERRE